MPLFLYKGYDLATGAPKKGKVEADSLKAARIKLRSKDRIVASELKEEMSVAKGKNTQAFSFLTPQSVGLKDLMVFTRQFATLQSAQVPLDETLKALTEQVDHLMLRNILAAVKDAVSEGKSLADALGAYPKTFDRLYVNMVKAGETSGNLPLALERLSGFLEYQVEIRGQVFSALGYPLIMMVMSLGIIIYLFVGVVPQMVKLISNKKVVLPWYTKLVINISYVLQYYWMFLVLGVVVIWFLFDRWHKTIEGKKAFDRFVLKVPLFGSVILRTNISTLTKTLSTLLGSGVPIIQALEVTKNIIDNTVISEVMANAKQAVQEGESFGAVIERSKTFPPLVSHMIKTGEKTGELEKMLKYVAEAYDAEVSREIETLISTIEPVMIAVLAGITVGLIFALLLPMMNMMSQVR